MDEARATGNFVISMRRAARTGRGRAEGVRVMEVTRKGEKRAEDVKTVAVVATNREASHPFDRAGVFLYWTINWRR